MNDITLVLEDPQNRIKWEMAGKMLSSCMPILQDGVPLFVCVRPIMLEQTHPLADWLRNVVCMLNVMLQPTQSTDSISVSRHWGMQVDLSLQKDIEMEAILYCLSREMEQVMGIDEQEKKDWIMQLFEDAQIEIRLPEGIAKVQMELLEDVVERCHGILQRILYDIARRLLMRDGAVHPLDETAITMANEIVRMVRRLM